MNETTNHEWADLLSAEPIPPEHNPIRKLMLGFLDPSEMTPEERLDELAAIFAAGFLNLRAGMAFPETQGQTTGAVEDKAFEGTESSLEPVSETRLCGSQKERIE